jgi:hypothetical protein
MLEIRPVSHETYFAERTLPMKTSSTSLRCIDGTRLIASFHKHVLSVFRLDPFENMQTDLLLRATPTRLHLNLIVLYLKHQIWFSGG